MPTPLVIDLSHHNMVTDFGKIAAAGIRGVIHKATEDVTFKDAEYGPRRQAATGAGLLWGAYHFLRPGDMKAQAKFFLDTAKIDAMTLIAADHEDEGVSVDDLKVFLSEVANAAGRSPVLYSGHVIKSQLGKKNDQILAQHRLWLADYETNPSWPVATWPQWWMWQYTDSGSPSGTTGKIDLDAYANAPDVLAREWSGVPGAAGAIPTAANEQLQGGTHATG